MLKRLKNIEGKADEQLLEIKDSKDNKDDQLSMKSIGYDIKTSFSPEGLDALKKIGDKEKIIDDRYLRIKPSAKNDFDFRMFLPLKLLFQRIYFGDILIPAVEREPDVFDTILEKLKKYKPRTKSNIEDKKHTLTSAQNLYDGREIIINTFKNKFFPLYSGNYYEELEEESSEVENEEPEDKLPTPTKTSDGINEMDEIYDPDLIKYYFMEKSLTKIISKLKDYKKAPEKLQIYNGLITCLNIGLKRLESDINNMSENEVENKKLDYLKI